MSSKLKNTILGLFLSCFFPLIGQDVVQKLPLNFQTGEFRESREAHPVINESTGELAYLLIGHQFIHAYLLDSDFQLKKELVVRRPKNKFKQTMAALTDGQHYYIYFSDKKTKKIASVKIDFLAENSEELLATFPRKTEGALYPFRYRDRLLLLETPTKDNDQVLFIHQFHQGKFIKSHWIDCSHFDYSTFNEERLFKTSLKRMLSADLVWISDPIVAQSVAIAHENKLFVENDRLVITINDPSVKNNMAMLSIDLENYTASLDYYPFELKTGDLVSTEHNSFYHQGKLYQLKTTLNELSFSIVNLSNGEAVYHTRVDSSGAFTFGNTAVHKKQWISKREKEISSARAVIWKMTKANRIGLSVSTIADTVRVDIKGYKTTSKGVAGVSILLNSGAAIGIGSTDYIPVSWTTGFWNSGEKEKFLEHLKFSVLFDASDFQPINTRSDEGVIHRILTYNDDWDEDYVARQIFIFNDQYYLGYYLLQNSKYYLRRFGK